MHLACSAELFCRGVNGGLGLLAARAFCKPSFICRCSAKNDVAIGDMVGLRIWASKTKTLATFYGGLLLQRSAAS